MPDRAFIYGRVAHASRGGEAAAEQLLKCEAYAASRGMTVVARAVDTPGARVADNQPGFAALLAAASGGVDVVLVTDVSRISRNPSAVDYVLSRAAKAGVRVITVASDDRRDQPRRMCRDARGSR